MNEIDLLARMREDVPDDPQALARARERLMDHVGTPPRRRRWVWPVAGVGGLAAAGLAVAVVLGGTTAPSVPDQVAGSGVLLLAAERAEHAPPQAGRYWVNRSESGTVSTVGSARDTYRVVQKGRSEFWIAQRPGEASWWISQSLGAEPLTPADRAAWERAGRPDAWTVQVPGKGSALQVPAAPGAPFGNRIDVGAEIFALGDRNVSQAELDALPTDPDGLRAALLDRFDGGGGDLPTDRDRWLFQVASNLVMDMPVRPAVRAGAYRMLAGLAGVHDLGAVEDAQGRPGQAVAVVDRTANGSTETRLVIDPASGDPLAVETRSLLPDGTAELAHYQLAVGTGYTDTAPPRVG